VVAEVWAREGKSGLVRITEARRCWKRGSLKGDVSESGWERGKRLTRRAFLRLPVLPAPLPAHRKSCALY
jgi:hypothetical protein